MNPLIPVSTSILLAGGVIGAGPADAHPQDTRTARVSVAPARLAARTAERLVVTASLHQANLAHVIAHLSLIADLDGNTVGAPLAWDVDLVPSDEQTYLWTADEQPPASIPAGLYQVSHLTGYTADGTSVDLAISDAGVLSSYTLIAASS